MREQEDLSCVIAKAPFSLFVCRGSAYEKSAAVRAAENVFFWVRETSKRDAHVRGNVAALPDGTFLSLVRVLLKTREHDAALCSHERPGNSELAHRSSHAFVVAPPHG
jgi:hypothetical protein